jgi:hypothetical protein
MANNFKTYFETLEALSTKALDLSAVHLVRAEKRNVAMLIAHIAEMSRRKADLECGYKNIFEYCVRRLNLSEGSVALRLQVANVCRSFPQLLVSLAENGLSLTVAGKLAPHLREDNVEKLLADCAGKTKREVDEYLVALRPKPVFNPSIRKRPSPENEKARPEPQQSSTPCVEQTPSQRPPSYSPNLLEPARRDLFNFRFSADRNFKKKFERLAEVLGVENPQKNMAEVFDKAIDISLEKKDPEKKLERRLEKKRRQSESAEKSRPDEILTPAAALPTGEGKAKSRYIPSEIRERVYRRAGYQCEFRGIGGTRCSSRTGLEIDHQRPFALYHSHDERYLRVACGRHNRFEAERVYGADYIRVKIDEKKRRNATRGAAGHIERIPHAFK